MLKIVKCRSEVRLWNKALGCLLLHVGCSMTCVFLSLFQEAVLSSRDVEIESLSGLSAVITDFNLRPLNSTSLQATWKSKFEEGLISFNVCLLGSPQKTCTPHGYAAVKSQEYIIGNLKPEAHYNVSAHYRNTVKGTFYEWNAYRTLTMPPPGWVSAASSPVFSGLLVLTSLLYFIVR
ncbi:hypothetical protein V5799_021751 [Amblyomma americanum]|uniref:Fibronectin type-III domain-containing protein n=1 Tax=Amblyomma americanum TaxID=6943 RepID=A0AAQ4FMI7_AMBAM